VHNRTCLGYDAKADSVQPYATCLPLTEQLLLGLRFATSAEVRRALDSDGEPADHNGLHFVSFAPSGQGGAVIFSSMPIASMSFRQLPMIQKANVPLSSYGTARTISSVQTSVAHISGAARKGQESIGGGQGDHRAYRPRLLRHRVEGYAARAAGWSCSCRKAAGVMKPCRSISQVAL
jgi:hypothetical protein